MAGLTAWAAAGAQASGLDRVCLGGGCFMNACLLAGLPPRLEKLGLTVYTPGQAPANDGGVKLGQAVAAASAWGRGMIDEGETILADDPEEQTG